MSSARRFPYAGSRIHKNTAPQHQPQYPHHSAAYHQYHSVANPYVQPYAPLPIHHQHHQRHGNPVGARFYVSRPVYAHHDMHPHMEVVADPRLHHPSLVDFQHHYQQHHATHHGTASHRAHEIACKVAEDLFLVRMCRKLIETASKGEATFLHDLTAKTLRNLRMHYGREFKEEELAWNPEEDSDFIRRVKDFALHVDYSVSSDSTYGKFLFPLNLPSEPLQAFKLCVRLGLFSEYDNIHLLVSRIEQDFPDWAHSAALDIKENPSVCPDLDKHIRKDYRHLVAFAIDSVAVTDEVDDAVSFESRPDGDWIHILVADATRYVQFGSRMDEFANNRSMSVYLPEKSIKMLPSSLSVDVLSLSEHRDNHVMCFSAQLDDLGDVVKYEITPAMVGPIKRVDYDDLDVLLEHKSNGADIPHESSGLVPAEYLPALNKLMDYANLRTRLRTGRGALNIYLPKSEAYVYDQGKRVEVKLIFDYESYSRRLVAELMILAGEVSAMFAEEHDVTVPFRGTQGRLQHVRLDQLPLEVPLTRGKEMSDEDVAELVLKETAKMTTVPSALVDSKPLEHATLGVAKYTQVTSPIRRYSDMLVHHQIKALIRGHEVPLKKDEVDKFIVASEAKSKVIRSLQKQSERFWTMHYLKNVLRDTPDKLFKCLVLSSFVDNYHSLFMLDIGFTSRVQLASTRDPGELIYLKLKKVDPLEGTMSVEQVSPPTSTG